jgi:hypothetical protein
MRVGNLFLFRPRRFVECVVKFESFFFHRGCVREVHALNDVDKSEGPYDSKNEHPGCEPGSWKEYRTD